MSLSVSERVIMLGKSFVAVALLASCSLVQAYPALLPYIYSKLRFGIE